MSTPLLSRTLIPLDGSETAEGILPHLHRLLPRHESQLILVQALPFGPLGNEHQAEQYLRRVAFQLTNDGYPATYVIRTGLAAETILRAAEEARASLIALSTHGRTGAMRWLMGSVAESVLQSSRLPVLVCRPSPSSQSRGMLESRPIRNFLIPLDGSRLSLGSLDALRELARPVDAHVTLLHVTEPTPYDGRWDDPDETMKEADQILREACIPARIEHRKGHAVEEILNFARDHQIDLIAMTTHGRSGPSRLLFGSVTTEVLRSSPVPLLVIRRPGPAPAPGPAALRNAADGSAPGETLVARE